MYGGDRVLLEEMLDEAECPLTIAALIIAELPAKLFYLQLCIC